MRAAPSLRLSSRRPLSSSARALLGATILAAVAGSAHADDIQVSSRITEATLFPDGATVTREAQFDAPEGRHVVILEDAPAWLDPATLRIEGASATGAFTILNTERGAIVLEPTEEENEERARIEDEIEEAIWRLRSEEDGVNLARERIDYVRRFRVATATAPTEGEGGGALMGSRADWQDAWATMDAEAAEAADALRQAERRVIAVREEIDALRRELALVGPATPNQTVLKITIDAETDVEGGRLEIAYLTNQASWAPIYDLRLQESDESVAEGTVEISRRAAIRQTTGENWTDINVTLSTARPSGRLAGRVPPEIIAKIQEPIRRSEPQYSSRFSNRAEDAVVGGYAAAAPADAALDAAEELAVVTEAEGDYARRERRAGQSGATARLEGERVVYELDELQTITGDGSTSFALIGEDQLDAQLEARAAPALETVAYLTAITTIEDALPPGVASVYRGEAYLGQTRLAYVAPGDEAELPFGAVEGLRIEYEVVERVRGGDDSAFETSETTRQRFLIRASNLSDRALPVVIYAAAPVSEDEQIKIETVTEPQPDEDRVEGRRNVLAWRFELASDAISEIAYGWDISWPEDEEIVFRAR